MVLMIQAVLRAAAIASIGVLAFPVAEPGIELGQSVEAGLDGGVKKLAKREEGFYFLDCGVNYSAVVYCTNQDNCDFNPGPGDSCLPTAAGLHNWLTGEQKCAFPGTSGTLTWRLHTDAEEWPENSIVGVADNGFRDFEVYKGDGRVMYTDGNSNACAIRYYVKGG